MKKKISHTIIFLLLAMGCNRSTEIDVPSQPSKLVLNGQWQQQASFIVKLTRSRGILDPFDTGSNLIKTYEVKNAFITISQNNIVTDTLKYDSVNFRYFNSSTRRTQLNSSYTVNASLNGYLPVSAGSSLYPLVPISNIKLKKNTRLNASGDSMDEVSFSFADDGSKTDYYLVRIRKADGGFAKCINTEDQDYDKMIFSNPFTTEACLDGNKLLLPDVNFNGRTKNILLYVPDDQMFVTTVSGRIKRPYVELMHITEEFYKYIKSINNYDIADNNPFAEPTNIFNNVKNGYGFFTAYALAVDTLR